MESELKYLKHYLDTGCKYVRHFQDEIFTDELTMYNISSLITDPRKKLLLSPMSDLTKEIEHNGERFVPYEDDLLCELMKEDEYLEYLCEVRLDITQINFIPFKLVDKLCHWHFDVFSLIPEGLAIDINTIE